MKHETVDGLVVRVLDRGDHDRYLSVLTAEQGRITVLAKGSRSMRGEQMGVSQLFTYANFEFYRRCELCILKGGSSIRSFYNIGKDMDRLNLASYLCELICELTDEGEPAGELLRLALNSFYAISEGLYSQAFVKSAFELRIAAMSGFAPETDACRRCGALAGDIFYLDAMNGAVLCGKCLHKKGKTQSRDGFYDDLREAEVISPLTPAALAAVCYCLSAPLERLFAFVLCDAEDVHLFSAAAETYLLSHIGHGFATLDFYRMMAEPTKGINT